MELNALYGPFVVKTGDRQGVDISLSIFATTFFRLFILLLAPYSLIPLVSCMTPDHGRLLYFYSSICFFSSFCFLTRATAKALPRVYAFRAAKRD